MKTIFPVLIILIIEISIYPYSELQESDLWSALKNHVSELKSKGKFELALSELNNFKKQYPESKYLSSLLTEIADIHLQNLGNIEKGFFFLEEASRLSDSSSLSYIARLKDKFADKITRIRLNKIQYFIGKYFAANLSFPKNLSVLKSINRGLSNNDVIDGYGMPLFFDLCDSPVFRNEDELSFRLFSFGKDTKPDTADDILPDKTFELKRNEHIMVLNTFRENEIWNAEVSFNIKKINAHGTKTIREGDVFFDNFVFGIEKNGILLLKDGKITVIKK